LLPAREARDDAGSVRAALDAAQTARPDHLRLLARASLVLWHETLAPFLAQRSGKVALASVAFSLLLLFGLRGPSGPLRGLLRAAIAPVAQRAQFSFEEGFASGFAAWTNPDVFTPHPDGLVQIHEGLTLYRPSLPRADYDFSFAGLIRRGALGWVVRAADPANYYAFKLTWRGRARDKRSVLLRSTVRNGSPAEAEKVVAMPFELEENKVYTIEVTVNGDRITTVVEGRGVDSFSDQRLPAGGVGFFAASGDSALVHSLTVSGNDTSAGRAFAWMLGFGRFLSSKVFGS
jgi:hypothetical protein